MPSAVGYDCYAITPPGVEHLTAGELVGLGITPGAIEPGGVSFRTRANGVARANLELRTASRVLVRMGTFHASAFHELERRAARLQWEAYLSRGRAVSFRVTSRKSKLYHQGGIAQRLAEAAARRVPGVKASSAGPGSDEHGAHERAADQLFVVRLFHDECTSASTPQARIFTSEGTGWRAQRRRCAKILQPRCCLRAAGTGACP